MQSLHMQLQIGYGPRPDRIECLVSLLVMNMNCFTSKSTHHFLVDQKRESSSSDWLDDWRSPHCSTLLLTKTTRAKYGKQYKDSFSARYGQMSCNFEKSLSWRKEVLWMTNQWSECMKRFNHSPWWMLQWVKRADWLFTCWPAYQTATIQVTALETQSESSGHWWPSRLLHQEAKMKEKDVVVKLSLLHAPKSIHCIIRH